MEVQWEHRLMNLAGDALQPARGPMVSYWADDLRLASAYAHCASITSRHSKSFFLASGLLPEAKRHAVRALYAFCRTVDDIVDAPAASDRQAALDDWRAISLAASAPQGNLVAAAWVDALQRYRIPRQYALQLIDGVSRDLVGTRYETFDDLSTYCYSVASTVGLMSMYIVGFRSRDAVPYAIKLGVALQMTNILRDVGEDLGNGRLYMPAAEMRAYGIRRADLESGRVTKAWRQFMRFQIDRARRLYAEAWPGVRLLDRDGQLSIAAASELYRGILDVIERNDYDVFSRRASLGAWSKAGRIPGLYLKLHLGF